MKNLFLIMATLFLLASCKDDVQPLPESQYSYWKVNGQSFSSNDIERAVGHARSGLQCRDANNRFSLGFYLSYLPFSGTWAIGDSITSQWQNSRYINIGFYYQNEFYIHSLYQKDSITATLVDKKARYYLAPSWFWNYYNHNDSVLIEGTFNEPYNFF